MFPLFSIFNIPWYLYVEYAVLLDSVQFAVGHEYSWFIIVHRLCTECVVNKYIHVLCVLCIEICAICVQVMHFVYSIFMCTDCVIFESV